MFGSARSRPVEDDLGFRRGRGRCVGRAVAAVVSLGLVSAAQAQQSPPQAVPPLEQRVDAFVAKLEARRQELGVVGAAVVVAQGDRILRIAGLGHRNAETKEPVTEDTLFPLASVTKQFTAIAVALAVSEGKMAFEDHPRRFVPDFRLKDPEADAKLNLIDLLAHRSGLERSDFTFQAGTFTQAELFALAGRATPAARLREKPLYNNTMFSLAGAVLARAYDTTYERFVTLRVLAPLGMRASTFAFDAFLAAANRAIGYSAGPGGAPVAAPPLNMVAIAPAGALNSTARDMGAWLKFLNARGQAGGLRIAPAIYARVFENHTLNGDEKRYGLGFTLDTWSGVKVAEHGGDVGGYSLLVFHLPERGLSFALLTNQNLSELRASASTLFWDTVVVPELPESARTRTGPPPVPPANPNPIAPDLLTGEYFRTQGGTLEIKKTDAGLVADLGVGVPPIPLKPSAVNRYELPGLGGVSISFADAPAMPGRFVGWLYADKALAFLKKDAAWLANAKARHRGAHAELIGAYLTVDRGTRVEIVPHGDGVALIDTAEPPRLLIGAGNDLFRLEGRPETYRLQFRRSRSRAVIGFGLHEPKRSLEMIVEASGAAGDPARAREILGRAVAAAGGAEALDRIATKTAIGRSLAATHGLDGPYEERVAPGKRAMLIELGAFGKTLLSYRQVSNERNGLLTAHGSDPIPLTGKSLAAARVGAVPHPLYRWKERYATVAPAGETVVNGENAFVIEMTPRGLAPTRLYISADTHMVLREEVPAYLGDTLLTSVAVDYSDYRTVNNVRMPFAQTALVPMLGRIVLAYDRMTLDAPIDPKVFESR